MSTLFEMLDSSSQLEEGSRRCLYEVAVVLVLSLFNSRNLASCGLVVTKAITFEITGRFQPRQCYYCPSGATQHDREELQ